MSGPADIHAALAQAFSAGKYAGYVWPAYAVTALGFAWMIFDTLSRASRWKHKADALERNRRH